MDYNNHKGANHKGSDPLRLRGLDPYYLITIKLGMMTQDERWMIRYEEVKAFIETNHQNPSKYVVSERVHLNWEMQQRKLMNAKGELL